MYIYIYIFSNYRFNQVKAILIFTPFSLCTYFRDMIDSVAGPDRLNNLLSTLNLLWLLQRTAKESYEMVIEWVRSSHIINDIQKIKFFGISIMFAAAWNKWYWYSYFSSLRATAMAKSKEVLNNIEESAIVKNLGGYLLPDTPPETRLIWHKIRIYILFKI